MPRRYFLPRPSALITAAVDPVRNGALNALKKDEAAKKNDEHGGAGDKKSGGGCVAMAGKSPAKPVNDARHGIEAIEPAPTLRNERTGIGDRRSEHPELEKERDDVFDVAIKRIERGEPQADAESRQDGEEQEERKQRGGGAGLHAGKQNDANKGDEADGEIEEPGEDGRERQDEAREKKLGNQARDVKEHGKSPM